MVYRKEVNMVCMERVKMVCMDGRHGGGAGGGRGGQLPPLADKGSKRYQMPHHFADLVE